jgi:hypothetical protein
MWKLRANTNDLIYKNNKSFKDFIEKYDPININIISSPKIEKQMDKTHESILNPFTRRKIVINYFISLYKKYKNKYKLKKK